MPLTKIKGSDSSLVLSDIIADLLKISQIQQSPW